jgi:hypothetical protein
MADINPAYPPANRPDLAALLRHRVDKARRDPGVLEALRDVSQGISVLATTFLTALLRG